MKYKGKMQNKNKPTKLDKKKKGILSKHNGLSIQFRVFKRNDSCSFWRTLSLFIQHFSMKGIKREIVVKKAQWFPADQDVNDM